MQQWLAGWLAHVPVPVWHREAPAGSPRQRHPPQLKTSPSPPGSTYSLSSADRRSRGLRPRQSGSARLALDPSSAAAMRSCPQCSARCRADQPLSLSWASGSAPASSRASTSPAWLRHTWRQSRGPATRVDGSATVQPRGMGSRHRPGTAWSTRYPVQPPVLSNPLQQPPPLLCHTHRHTKGLPSQLQYECCCALGSPCRHGRQPAAADLSQQAQHSPTFLLQPSHGSRAPPAHFEWPPVTPGQPSLLVSAPTADLHPASSSRWSSRTCLLLRPAPRLLCTPPTRAPCLR